MTPSPLKTARLTVTTPGFLDDVFAHLPTPDNETQCEAVVAARAKPKAASALGVSLHHFNKHGSWETLVPSKLSSRPGKVLYRPLGAKKTDPWWYRDEFNEIQAVDLNGKHWRLGADGVLRAVKVDEHGQELTSLEEISAQAQEDRYATPEEAAAQHDDGEWEDQTTDPVIPPFDAEAYTAAAEATVTATETQTVPGQPRDEAEEIRELAILLLMTASGNDRVRAEKDIDLHGVQHEMFTAMARTARHFYAD